MPRIGNREFGAHDRLVMAIVNATPDSFYDGGRAFGLETALEMVDDHVAGGADIVDVGGVKAGLGPEVTVAEEIRRIEPLISAMRARYPDLPISVDTWRSDVARAALSAGANLINDAWGGFDIRLAAVAATYDVGIVCTHTGGLTPRAYAKRVRYADVVVDVADSLTRLARSALDAGVSNDQIIIDPGHDFGKNTFHSLELTRRISELVELGWPVLVAVSNKDFIGETLGLDKRDRIEGTLAALALCAWQGARIFRVHNVVEARRTVDMVASIAGHRAPARTIRSLT